MDYDNTNRGALFRAEKKSEKHPDYTGKINIGGNDHYLAGWIKESKAGDKFMSLSLGDAVEQKQQPKQQKQQGADFYDEDIPF